MGYFIYKAYLFVGISAVVKKEAGRIQLSNELISEREINKYSGCGFDYKRGGITCDSNYDKYYAVDNDPFDEFNRVYEYLTDLGWYCKYPPSNSRDKFEESIKKGFMPSCLFEKDSKYYLRVYLNFLGAESDRYSDKLNSLMDKYHPSFPSLYRISVTADLKG